MDTLERVWEVELTILDEIDMFCRKHGIRYSLAYGTMLGAVRHKGFIPWDDDVDVIMPRSDYNRFVDLWSREQPEGFFLQNKYIENGFTQNFTKIRKEHTTFLQSKWDIEAKIHTGVFVDVFPGNWVAPTKWGRKKQFIVSALNLLYARGKTSQSNGLIIFLEKLMLSLPTKLKMQIFILTDRYLQKYNDESNGFFFPNTIDWARKIYPADMFDDLIEIDFAGRKYLCAKDYEKILTYEYGDYMQLPPVEQRKMSHHPILVNLGKNYYELSDDEKYATREK